MIFILLSTCKKTLIITIHSSPFPLPTNIYLKENYHPPFPTLEQPQTYSYWLCFHYYFLTVMTHSYRELNRNYKAIQ